jgi:hypothetical protein
MRDENAAAGGGNRFGSGSFQSSAMGHLLCGIQWFFIIIDHSVGFPALAACPVSEIWRARALKQKISNSGEKPLRQSGEAFLI